MPPTRVGLRPGHPGRSNTIGELNCAREGWLLSAMPVGPLKATNGTRDRPRWVAHDRAGGGLQAMPCVSWAGDHARDGRTLRGVRSTRRCLSWALLGFLRGSLCSSLVGLVLGGGLVPDFVTSHFHSFLSLRLLSSLQGCNGRPANSLPAAPLTPWLSRMLRETYCCLTRGIVLGLISVEEFGGEEGS